MHRKFSSLLLSAVFFTAILSFAADNGTELDMTIRQLWLDGFLKMSKAAHLADQGSVTNAIKSYNDAIKLFSEIHATYPKWNPSMVSYRISSCRQRIQELEAVNEPIDVRNLSVEGLRQRLRTEITRNASLVKKLDEALENQKTEDDVAALQAKEAQILTLKKQIVDLDTKLRIEQAKVARLQKDDSLDKLRKELADIAIAKEDVERKNDTLNRQLEDATRQLAEQKEQLKELNRLGDAEKAAEIAKAENEQLKQAITDLNSKLTFFKENIALHLKSIEDIDKLEKMAVDMEDENDAATIARYWHTISNKFLDAQEPALRAAYWYWAVNDHDNSNLMLDRYFQTTARNIDPIIMLGRVSLDQNNWQRALALTAWATAAAPGNADAQFSLGAVFLSTAQTSLAKGCFRKAVAIDEKHAESLFALAIIYATAEPRNLKEAKVFYERAVAAGHARDLALEAVVK